MDLEALKKQFLARTKNVPGKRDRAGAAAVAAASQRNLLYAPDAGWRDRNEVRAYWKRALNELAAGYDGTVSAGDYEEGILALQIEMNRQFADRFHAGGHPRFRYEAGFRISHAQKSLAVYLKHLWCLGEFERPPACPVDSIVLRKAGLAGRYTRWAFVNTIEDHRWQIAQLQQAASTVSLPLADWELSVWAG